MRSIHVSRSTGVALIGLMLGLAGCSGKSPVRGTVSLEDGTPLSKGLIVFERFEGGPPLTARGEIGPDGRFELSTDRPGDGVLPGKYRATINPLDASDAPDEDRILPFALKYVNARTTDLEFEIKSGPNELPIRLAPFDRKGRK